MIPPRTRLAVPLTSAQPPPAAQMAAAAAGGADLVELRVDCIGDVPAVEAALRAPRVLPVLLTVRSKSEGGAWTGEERARIGLLLRLAALAPDYVDVEAATWRAAEPVRRWAAARAGGVPRLIISQHDLEDTPADVAAALRTLREIPADVHKAVFTARDATDALRVAAALARAPHPERLIALAMGEAGLVTRVLARKFNAFLTFASLAEGRASAPGQPTLSDLRTLLRWDAVGPDTPLFGVAGWPVRHSLSPRIHNAALAATGRAGVYVPLPVGPDAERWQAFMAAARDAALDVRGLSVTLPHKEHAHAWLAGGAGILSPTAARCRAVNTLTHDPAAATWCGDNTDAQGVRAALDAAVPGGVAGLRGRTASVLGAGGVARAVVAVLVDLGCRVTVFNRTAARAAELAREFGCEARPWEARRTLADVLVNCTSVGLWPDIDTTPLADEDVPRDAVVMDTIYRPRETRLLRVARARGCIVVDGLEMFIQQAAAQFEQWHGTAAPRAAMRAAVADR